MCGENDPSFADDPRLRGSSPRVRGKPRPRLEARTTRGLIPACAGKTSRCPYHPYRRPAHPRVCGENDRSAWPSVALPGSSPRVRGKRRILCSWLYRRGLIPACAGKTPGGARHGAVSAAHPRVCGENIGSSSFIDGEYGSSPRVRGKLIQNFMRTGLGGLIPACAGKTLSDLEF